MLHTHIEQTEEFIGRHIGPNDAEQAEDRKSVV